MKEISNKEGSSEGKATGNLYFWQNLTLWPWTYAYTRMVILFGDFRPESEDFSKTVAKKLSSSQ